MEAAQRKLEGEEVTEVPGMERKGKVIDLMAALKASLEKRGFVTEEGEPAVKGAASAGKVAKAHERAARATGRTRGVGKK